MEQGKGWRATSEEGIARGIHVAWAMEGQRKTIWEDTLQDACNACKMKRIREERGGRRTDQRK